MDNETILTTLATLDEQDLNDTAKLAVVRSLLAAKVPSMLGRATRRVKHNVGDAAQSLADTCND